MTSGPGFAVLYRWRLYAGKEATFIRSWAKVSELLLQRHGSLGSRLHKGPDDIWYSYAQWPSSAARDLACSGQSEDPQSMAEMRSAIAEGFPEMILEPVADFMVLPAVRGDA